MKEKEAREILSDPPLSDSMTYSKAEGYLEAIEKADKVIVKISDIIDDVNCTRQEGKALQEIAGILDDWEDEK